MDEQHPGQIGGTPEYWRAWNALTRTQGALQGALIDYRTALAAALAFQVEQPGDTPESINYVRDLMEELAWTHDLVVELYAVEGPDLHEARG